MSPSFRRALVLVGALLFCIGPAVAYDAVDIAIEQPGEATRVRPSNSVKFMM